MAAFSTIALIGGLALGAAGTATQMVAAQEQAEAQKKQLAAEQSAAAARKQQADLEIQRQKREVIRKSILARAQAEATATNQGQFGSALPSADAGILGETAFNMQGLGSSQFIGNESYAASLAGFSARRQESDAASLASMGAGLSTLGGALTKNLGPIGRLTYGLG